jgi:hypothetical protein
MFRRVLLLSLLVIVVGGGAASAQTFSARRMAMGGVILAGGGAGGAVIAFTCASLNLKRAIRRVRASSVSFDLRIMAMTSSRNCSAMRNPSKM